MGRDVMMREEAIKILAPTLFFAVLCVASTSAAAFQKPGRPDDEPSGKTAAGSDRTGSKRTGRRTRTGAASTAPQRRYAATANLTITIIPSDSTLTINGQVFSYPEDTGEAKVTGLKAGTQTIVVTRNGYRESRTTMSLSPGESDSLNIALDPLPGSLTISPTVAGTELTLRRKGLGRDDSIGTYMGRIRELPLAPGTYQLTISKDGFRTATRDFEVKPAQSIYLEPGLEPLPTPETPRIRGDARTLIQSFVSGKYLIVSLTGRSGDPTSQLGTLDVTVNMNATLPDTVQVRGMLPGFPCQVDFVRLENIAEYSFVEAPGAGNQWGKTVVRVRPKDSKRAVHFSIIWKAIQAQPAQSAPAPLSPTADMTVFEPAIVIKSVSPSYPPTARNARISGVVAVFVSIDDKGQVVDAKALDGPLLLRGAAESAARQFKFQPARSNNQPVSSTQTLKFNFQL